MKTFFQPSLYVLMLFVIGTITSCGGGGTESANETPTKTIEPIVEPPPEKCTYSDSGENNGVPYSLSTESKYTGDIKFNCSYDGSQPTAQQYFLINGVPSLNIADMTRDTMITGDCTLDGEEFKDSVEVNFDYKTGIVKTSSQSSAGGDSSCTSKYSSPLETTLSSQDSIKLLFDAWGVDVSEVNKDQTGLIETDCPQVAAATNNTNGIPVCKVLIKDKFNVTDESGKIHTIEKMLSY